MKPGPIGFEFLPFQFSVCVFPVLMLFGRKKGKSLNSNRLMKYESTKKELLDTKQKQYIIKNYIILKFHR